MWTKIREITDKRLNQEENQQIHKAAIGVEEDQELNRK